VELECFVPVGDFADTVGVVDSFASFFWPRAGVNYAKLQSIHAKMMNVSVPPQRWNARHALLTCSFTRVQQTEQKHSPSVAPAAPPPVSAPAAPSSKKKRVQPAEHAGSPAAATPPVKKIKLVHRTQDGAPVPSPAPSKAGSSRKKQQQSTPAAVKEDEDELME
jgi:hypothetical protein